MIVGNFHVERVAAFDAETHAPFVVDADAPPPFAIVLQSFQPIRRRQAQILDTHCGVKCIELVLRALAKLCWEPLGAKSQEHSGSKLIVE